MGGDHRVLDPRVRHVLRTVDVLLSDPTLTVERLASAVSLTPARLRQLMDRHVGQSPRQYLATKRLMRAEYLLTHTFLSIKQITVAVGVNDPTHLGREFKKLFGATPREYRERALNHRSPRCA